MKEHNTMQPEEEERLKEENDFLKLKLMLERGAQFGTNNSDDLTAKMENDFLHYVAEFERQAESAGHVKVFDKIGRPGRFRPLSEIADKDIPRAWDELHSYLCENGISLSACSPRVSVRELYRFTVEELFECEVEDITIPGMMHGFIYDEFYPDHKYDNTRTAVEECIRTILKTGPLNWMPFLKENQLRFNETYPLTNKQFLSIINDFRSLYDSLDIMYVHDSGCVVEDGKSWVEGSYQVIGMRDRSVSDMNGYWRVDFEKEDEAPYWTINALRIEGLDF